MHGLGPENTLTVEFAAVEQHLPKAHVVADGCKRASAAAVGLRRRIEKFDRLRFAGQRVIGKWPGKTSALRLRGVERGVLHAERLPHIAGQVFAKPLLAHLFDHRAEHVDREAVFENGRWLVRQRQFCDAIDERLRIALDRRRRAVRVLTRYRARAVRASAIHQAGCVSIKVVDVDRRNLRFELQRTIRLRDADLHLGERGIVVGKLGLKRQAALFHECEARDGGHRLGHGGKREHGIQRHRLAFGRIKLAVRLVLDQLSVAGYRDHGAGHTLCGDLASKESIQASQSLLGKSDVVRLGLG